MRKLIFGVCFSGFLALSGILSAQPKVSYDTGGLVLLASLNEDWLYDIRYATEKNAFGIKLYPVAKPMLVKPAALALVRVHQELKKEGFGLVIFDAYRPYHVTVQLWNQVDSTKKNYVASPLRGSRHNRGCAVDAGLYVLKTGKQVEMPSNYDDFSEKAASDYPGGTVEERKNRMLLRQIMEKNGFKVLASEWWHFDFQGWENFPLLDVSLEENKN